MKFERPPIRQAAILARERIAQILRMERKYKQRPFGKPRLSSRARALRKSKVSRSRSTSPFLMPASPSISHTPRGRSVSPNILSPM